MILLLIFLDVLINNYTKYTSFFFIIYLYNKSYKYYLITAFILDFIIFNTYFYNLIILTIMYFCNKSFKNLNKNNIYNYVFINIHNYILYIFISKLLMINSLENILVSIGSHLLVNITFYLLSFRLYSKMQKI